MVSIIVFLFIAIMLVLIRRMKSERQDDFEWEDEFEDEDDEGIYNLTKQLKNFPHANEPIKTKMRNKKLQNLKKTYEQSWLLKQNVPV